MPISRRDFITTSATAAAGLALGPAGTTGTAGAQAAPRSPAAGSASARAAGRPVVIASANGLRGVKVAYDRIAQGTDTLDAILAGVNIQELDPEDGSVGLGGLPNADGIVQLDASCMHGPTKRAGAVACLEDIATPSLVAKAVMDHTDHILLVGDDAKRFAVGMGFQTQNLLTEKSRHAWLQWKARLNADDNWLDAVKPPDTQPYRHPGVPVPGDGNAEKLSYDANGVPFTYGTINMNAVNANGDISSVTTTSGLSWKIPGRVGDSPIVGAGQYCDNTVGAAGSTGRGEASIKVCGAFLAVEFMRQGMSPEQALLKVIERVIAMTESRLLDDRGRPYFDLDFYAVAKDGRFAGASAYEGSRYAVCDAQGARLVDSAFVFKRAERPRRG